MVEFCRVIEVLRLNIRNVTSTGINDSFRANSFRVVCFRRRDTFTHPPVVSFGTAAFARPRKYLLIQALTFLGKSAGFLIKPCITHRCNNRPQM